MLKRIALLILLLIGLKSVSSAQTMEAVRDSKFKYNFWVSTPEGYEDSICGLPLMIFLHGRSLCGNDLNRVKRYGILYEIERGKKVPMVVLAPQCPKGQHWDADAIDELVSYVCSKINIDTFRVYVAGMSLGGYGALHYAGKYPKRVAAVAALCGGGNPADACGMKQLPVWMIHGKADKAVPYTQSVQMWDAIKSCGGDKVILTLVAGWDHGAPARYFRRDDFYEWFLQYSKPANPEPPSVN